MIHGLNTTHRWAAEVLHGHDLDKNSQSLLLSIGAIFTFLVEAMHDLRLFFFLISWKAFLSLDIMQGFSITWYHARLFYHLISCKAFLSLDIMQGFSITWYHARLFYHLISCKAFLSLDIMQGFSITWYHARLFYHLISCKAFLSLDIMQGFSITWYHARLFYHLISCKAFLSLDIMQGFSVSWYHTRLFCFLISYKAFLYLEIKKKKSTIRALSWSWTSWNCEKELNLDQGEKKNPVKRHQIFFFVLGVLEFWLVLQCQRRRELVTSLYPWNEFHKEWFSSA